MPAAWPAQDAAVSSVRGGCSRYARSHLRLAQAHKTRKPLGSVYPCPHISSCVSDWAFCFHVIITLILVFPRLSQRGVHAAVARLMFPVAHRANTLVGASFLCILHPPRRAVPPFAID